MTTRASAKRFVRTLSVGVTLFGVGFVVLPGCTSPGTPTLNKMAVQASDGLAGVLLQTWDDGARGDDEATLLSMNYDSSGGLTAQQGQAGTVLLLPLFDDPSGNSDAEFASLGGQLHVVGSSPDILETTLFKGSATNQWQLLGIAKKLGHVDLVVTIDGHPGSITMGVDVVAQAAASNSSDDDGGTDGGS